MEKKRMPKTKKEWLTDIAEAYKDAREAIPFGKFSLGRPLKEDELFHLAPQVCFKFRGIKASEKRKNEIVEGTLASYIATMDGGEGGNILKESPMFGFCFCYLAAHYVADLLEDEKVAAIMDYCVERVETLESLISDNV